MIRKKINIGLSDNEINHAINELKTFNNDFQKKVNVFRARVAKEISDIAGSAFSGAIVDDLTETSGGARKAHVDMSVNEQGDVSVVIATGEDAVWVEFGAGVFHNGSVGSSPHPKGSELGFTIGSFGENGSRDTWGFYEGEELRITHGTPAVMPMYNAMETVCKELSKICEEVFR